MRDDLAELVRHDEDRDAVPCEPAQRREERVDLCGREHRGRFVEDEDARLTRELAQDLDALRDADGQVLDDGVGIDVEAVLARELSHACLPMPRAQHGAAPGLVTEHDVLPDAQPLRELEVLMHEADAARRLALARRRPQRARGDRGERRFPRAVLTAERVDLARQQGERHAVERDDAAVEAPADPAQDERGGERDHGVGSGLGLNAASAERVAGGTSVPATISFLRASTIAMFLAPIAARVNL